MNSFLVWGVVVSFGIAWFLYLFFPIKGASLGVRFASISAIFFLSIGIWGGLVWLWHLIQK